MALGERILSFRGAFDIAAQKTGITARDATYGERFTPHCYRRAAISRWTKSGLPDAIVRMCIGHANRDVHEAYIQFENYELVEAFDKAGLLSPPPVQRDVSAESERMRSASPTPFDSVSKRIKMKLADFN